MRKVSLINRDFRTEAAARIWIVRRVTIANMADLARWLTMLMLRYQLYMPRPPSNRCLNMARPKATPVARSGSAVVPRVVV